METEHKSAAKKNVRKPRKRDRSLLGSIATPDDLRKCRVEKLRDIAAELRDMMLREVSKHGGHLAPSLGAVELAIALHYCFDTPRDKLIWDVGHQAYAHKILTGRREAFTTLRQYGGISGFPRTSESEYDALSTGHASTSISAGLGMALARDIREEHHHVISVIGDGSLSGGLALEGLNNLGSTATPMIVVLNDNEMSISKNVGALSRYLTRVLTDRRFNKIKNDVWDLLGNLSNVGKGIRSLVHNVDETLKHFVIPGKLFEDMGLRYYGPVDGHNIREMIEVFRFVRDSISEPVLVHVITKKGKGYSFAESDATKYHGISSFSRSTGTVMSNGDHPPAYSSVFGKTLVELGKDNTDIVAVTAAMPNGTGLNLFRDAYPKRFFDVGIAEQHAVTFSAGLALKGLKPAVALYSTFLQRAYDQIIHDVALDNLHVVFFVDRAGLVGDDGPTHHGCFDVSFLRTIPNMTIMAPRDENQLRHMVYTALLRCTGPVAVRYPRGWGAGVPLDSRFAEIPAYRPAMLQQGSGCVVITTGVCCHEAYKALALLESDGMSPTLVDARFLKPLDEEFYTGLFASHSHVVTIENNTLPGGFGSAVLDIASRMPGTPPRVLTLGYPDRFIEHGLLSQLHKNLCLDAEGLAQRIREFLG